MPAGLPGDSVANNTGANPSAGRPITFDPLSGPKGSPFDKDPVGKTSTGALSTGIGFNPIVTIEPPPATSILTVAQMARSRGFYIGESPGSTLPNGSPTTNSILMYIGGGRSSSAGASVGRPFPPSPYTNGYSMGAAGNGGARDAGVGPTQFSVFAMTMLNNSGGSVANGAVIGAGNVNYSGAALPNLYTTFGVSNAASALPS